MSEVTIETDTFQTWQFDIVYMNSFIEREHVSMIRLAYIHFQKI